MLKLIFDTNALRSHRVSFTCMDSQSSDTLRRGVKLSFLIL